MTDRSSEKIQRIMWNLWDLQSAAEGAKFQWDRATVLEMGQLAQAVDDIGGYLMRFRREMDKLKKFKFTGLEMEEAKDILDGLTTMAKQMGAE